MARRPKPEEIVSEFRQVDVLVAQGKTVADSVRSIGVTEVIYYRWRKELALSQHFCHQGPLQVRHGH